MIPALDRIIADLTALRDELAQGHPIDTHDLRTAARRLDEQAHMADKDLLGEASE